MIIKSLKISKGKALELAIPGSWVLALNTGEPGAHWTRRDFYTFQIEALQGYREALERKTAGAVGLISPTGMVVKTETIRPQFFAAVVRFLTP